MAQHGTELATPTQGDSYRITQPCPVISSRVSFYRSGQSDGLTDLVTEDNLCLVSHSSMPPPVVKPRNQNPGAGWCAANPVEQAVDFVSLHSCLGPR